VSTLSRLESGDRKPTLELLLPLARAHGVTLDELADGPPTGDPRVHPRPVTRDGMTMLPLTPRAGGIQAYKLIIPAEHRRDPDPQSHEGYEWLYVLDGTLDATPRTLGRDLPVSQRNGLLITRRPAASPSAARMADSLSGARSGPSRHTASRCRHRRSALAGGQFRHW